MLWVKVSKIQEFQINHKFQERRYYCCWKLRKGKVKNPSAEAIFGNIKIKEEHETLKLQNEEVMLKNT